MQISLTLTVIALVDEQKGKGQYVLHCLWYLLDQLVVAQQIIEKAQKPAYTAVVMLKR